MTKFRKHSRLERWLGFLGLVVVGGVFAWVSWMEEKEALGVFALAISAVGGLYLLLASDEELNKPPRWWMFWQWLQSGQYRSLAAEVQIAAHRSFAAPQQRSLRAFSVNRDEARAHKLKYKNKRLGPSGSHRQQNKKHQRHV